MVRFLPQALNPTPPLAAPPPLTLLSLSLSLRRVLPARF